MSKLTGIIKSFDSDYGYINQDNGGADLFVSSYVIEGYKVLPAGQKVSYEVKQGPRGPEADNVVVL